MNNASHHDRPRWQWWIIFIAIAIALPLGTWGFLMYEGHSFEFKSVLNALYHAGQLFLLHTPHLDKPVPLALEIARWLAAAAFAAAAISGALQVFGIELRRLFIRFRKHHVVICGAGWRGLPLARDFRFPSKTDVIGKHARRPESVVVIEKDPVAHGLRICRELGIPYLVADATSPKVLKAAGAQNARLLIAGCTGDGDNLEIAIRARQLAEELRSVDGALQCYVHLANLDLRTIARQKQLVAGDGHRFRATTIGIDVYENSARWLFQHYDLDRLPIPVQSPLRVHLVIIGFGQMGESVLLQAARIGHFANAKKLRATVIALDAATREMAVRNRYPQIKEVCDIEFRASDAGDSALVDLARQFCIEPDSLVTLVACLPDNSQNLALALKLGDALKETRTPIRVRIDSRAGLALLLSEKKQRELFGDQICPFGMLEEVAAVETLERREIDAVARAIHEVYVEKETKKGGTVATNASLVSWDELSEDFRNSNRQAADHLEIKLHAIGCHMMDKPGKSEPLTELRPPEIEILALMEHARFCAERFLGGWKLAPAPKNPALKTSPTLVPWADLPEKEREKDRDQVRAIPRIVVRIGKFVCR